MTERTEAAPPYGETLLAALNALKLGGSLLSTWIIGIGVRLALPRALGPATFGKLTWAEAFAATFLVVLNLGVDTYVRKQIAVRPAHASDFFGGTFLLRILLTALTMAAMTVEMRITDRASDAYALVYLFAVAQLCIAVNASLSAMLHARGKVDGMSVLSVASKIAWGAGMLGAIHFRAPLWAFPAVLLVTEAVEGAVLYRLAARHLGLVPRLDLSATKTMILASLPYFLATFASTVYGKLDVTLLDALGTSVEVGWYSAASTIAGLTLLATPLVSWVLMPAFARAAERSRDELYARVRWSTEIVLAVALPASLFVDLGAELWVRFLFGPAYAPAVAAVRILATTFVLTYAGMIYAMALMMIERAWTLTAIAFGGLVTNAVSNAVLIRPFLRAFGDGGGGAGCALAVLATELVVTVSMAIVVGCRAFDRPMVTRIGKSLGACGLVVALDHVVAPTLGWTRLVLCGAVYLAVVVATGALRVRELYVVVTDALGRHAHRA